MRKHDVVAIVVALAGSLTACGGSATMPSSTSGVCPTIPGFGSMCATIDGVAWTASNVARADNPVSCERSSQGPVALTCGAFDNQGRALYFVLPLAASTTGAHQLGPGLSGSEAGSLGAFNGLSSFYDTDPAGGSGTVTITSLTDTNVVGSFSFTVVFVRSVLTRPVPAAARHVITDGTFNVTKVIP